MILIEVSLGNPKRKMFFKSLESNETFSLHRRVSMLLAIVARAGSRPNLSWASIFRSSFLQALNASRMDDSKGPAVESLVVVVVSVAVDRNESILSFKSSAPVVYAKG